MGENAMPFSNAISSEWCDHEWKDHQSNGTFLRNKRKHNKVTKVP